MTSSKRMGIKKVSGLATATAVAAMMATTAHGADLGGDCCGDLEERVAELEATTVRKGNRRMSLTLSGQVSRSILYWDDGDRSGTYAGLDQFPQSTRFTFSGEAKVSPSLKAGFEIMTELGATARTSTVDQNTPDAVTPVSGAPSTIAAGADGTLAVRTANWYLEDRMLGRITVGRLNVGGPVATIDLGGISTVASNSPSLVGGAFQVTGTPAEIFAGTGTRLAFLVGPSYGGDRMEGIRWDSANFGGFVAQAAWGEDDIWSASIRYAADVGGFRLAAGIGVQGQNDTDTQTIQLDTGARFLDQEWAGSLAVMHVGTGLFLQGHYARSEFFNGEEANIWLVQGGITKNWFGLGNTSIYGEYGEAQDYIKSGLVFSASAGKLDASGSPDASSQVDFYGIGIVQQIDAAAMEVFLGWRRYEVGVSGLVSDENLRNGSSDLDLITGGARIRF